MSKSTPHIMSKSTPHQLITLGITGLLINFVLHLFMPGSSIFFSLYTPWLVLLTLGLTQKKQAKNNYIAKNN